jgi:TolA-binding protein
MKRTAVVIAMSAFFVLAFLLACGDQEEAEKPKAEVTSEDVKKETREAMETAQAYTQQQKEEYLQRMNAKLEEVNQEIQELTAKTQSQLLEMKEDAKAELNKDIEALRSRQQEMTQKLEELKSASGSAWDDIKSGMDAAMEDLNQALARARSHFEEG